MVDLVLTEADAGRTVEVAPGAAVQLRLAENPTTGYRWTLIVTPAGCLQATADTFERPDTAAVGTGGVRVVDIKTSDAPHCELGLAYRRPWESEDLTASRLSYRFVTTR